MNEEVMTRTNYDDVDVANITFILYDEYDKAPSTTDYVHGERREIVLRNQMTGKLEKIVYVLCGAVPSLCRKGYHQWFFGDVIADGPHACLCFNYDNKGELERIHLSFCAKSVDPAEFQKLIKNISYAAEATVFDAYTLSKEQNQD